MDMSLVSTDDIWNELVKRNDAVVLVLFKDSTAQCEEHVTYFSGGRMRAVGLLVQSQHDLLTSPSLKRESI